MPFDGSPKNDASIRWPAVSRTVPFAEYETLRRSRSQGFPLFNGKEGPGGADIVRVSHEGSIAPKKNARSLMIGPPPSAPASVTCVLVTLMLPLGDITCVQSP